ncbi:MAG: AraC family transcriptional regulator [Clostridia bacterium]|nr:AraC family transcriptional regulator [Clostridia bacterium]
MKPYFEHMHVRNAELPNLNVIMGGFQQCTPNYTYGPVMRQYYILFYVLGGKGEFTVNGVTYRAGAKDGFLAKPYEAHIFSADAEDPWEYLWIGFDCGIALPKIFEDQYLFDAAEYEELFLRFRQIHAAGGDPVAYSANLYEIFTKMHAAEQRESRSRDIVSRAKKIIESEYADLTVEALARRFYLNRSYFGALFKKKTGKTPKAYIDGYRLSIATKLICEFGYSVTQAAYATGYGDRTVFSKTYKKHFGIPPGAAHPKKGGTIRLK